MIRHALALLISAAATTSSMAGVTHAFDYRPPERMRNCCGPADDVPPIILYTYAARADELRCPTESRAEWPASPPRWNLHPWVRAPEATAWSPVYCVRIGASGRVLSLRLAAGSGNAVADRQLARKLRAMRFTAAGWHNPVTAWHRVVVSLPGRPEGHSGTPHRGPELHLHFVG